MADDRYFSGLLRTLPMTSFAADWYSAFSGLLRRLAAKGGSQ